MKKVIILAIVAMLSLGGAVGVKAAQDNKPENLFFSVLSKAIDDLKDRDEIRPVTKCFDGGSLEFLIGSEQKTEEYAADFNISGKMYFGSDAFMLEDLTMKFDQSKIGLTVYSTDNMFYIESDEILGGAYGIKLGNMASEFENSIFAYGSGSEYAIEDEEYYNKMLHDLGELDKQVNSSFRADGEKLLREYMQQFKKTAVESLGFEKTNEDVSIGDETVNLRKISMTIDKEDIVTITDKFCEFIKTDDELKKFTEEYKAELNLMFAEDMKLTGYTDVYEYLLRNIDETVKAIKEQIIPKLSDKSLLINLYTKPASKKLLKLELYAGEKELLDLDFGGKTIKEADNITLKCGENTRANYVIEKNDSEKYTAKLKVNGMDIASITNDRKEEKFDLTVYSLLGNTSYRGDLTNKDGVISLRLNETVFKAVGGTSSVHFKNTLNLIISEKDTVPKPNEDMKTIFEITEEDINRLKELYEQFSPENENIYSQ